jgi:hypothetical protein
MTLQVRQPVTDGSALEADDGTGFTSTLGTDTSPTSHTAAASRINVGLNYNVDGGTGPIPTGARVASCHLEVHLAKSNADDPNLTIFMEDVDDSADFSADPDVTSRVRTTTSVDWVATGIGNNGYQDSPELKAIMQEVLGRGGWNGNVTVLLDGKDDLDDRLLEFNGSPTSGNRAKLFTTWYEEELTAGALVAGKAVASKATPAPLRAAAVGMGRAVCTTTRTATARASALTAPMTTLVAARTLSARSAVIATGQQPATTTARTTQARAVALTAGLTAALAALDAQYRVRLEPQHPTMGADRL